MQTRLHIVHVSPRLTCKFSDTHIDPQLRQVRQADICVGKERREAKFSNRLVLSRHHVTPERARYCNCERSTSLKLGAH